MKETAKELITRLIKEDKITLDEAMVLMDEYGGKGRDGEAENISPTTLVFQPWQLQPNVVYFNNGLPSFPIQPCVLQDYDVRNSVTC